MADDEPSRWQKRVPLRRRWGLVGCAERSSRVCAVAWPDLIDLGQGFGASVPDTHKLLMRKEMRLAEGSDGGGLSGLGWLVVNSCGTGQSHRGRACQPLDFGRVRSVRLRGADETSPMNRRLRRVRRLSRLWFARNRPQPAGGAARRGRFGASGDELSCKLWPDPRGRKSGRLWRVWRLWTPPSRKAENRQTSAPKTENRTRI